MKIKPWMAVLLVGCWISTAAAVTITDDLGRKVTLDKVPERVVCWLGSYAQSWQLAGGTVLGATDDVITENRLPDTQGITVVGGTHHPGLEATAALAPELVLISAELSPQTSLIPSLQEMGIPCAAFTVSTWQEDLEMMEKLCLLTGREDLYLDYCKAVEVPVTDCIHRAEVSLSYQTRTALLLRATGTAVKARGSDNQAGAILKDMGLINIADNDSGLLENLSLEAILMADPDDIFVLTMGNDRDAAWQAFEKTLTSNPAWQSLTAVQNGHVYELERSLFQLKPNKRWAEAYQIMEQLINENE